MTFSNAEIAKIYGVDGPPYIYGVDWQGPCWTTTYNGGWKTLDTTDGLVPDHPSLPESVCPNCRRDWHSVPLTESVARMCDGLSFDEGYDPDADVSGVVCPGSDCCGPAVQLIKASNGGFSSAPLVMYWDSAWTISPHPAQKAYAKLLAMETSLKILLGPEPAWTFEPESYTSPTYEDCLKDILADSLPAIKVSAWTWLPGDEEDVQQAALEAAPKAIEHKPPKSTGFDFSDFDIPDYSPPKGKKKK